jgi:CHAT domain-containing protein/tetratricopeptide (TPR) repeat protein
MSRSSRRRRQTALLLLLWQGAVLAPGAVSAHAAQPLPAGESQSVAQSTKPAAKGIPAEVVQWFDAMKEAADKGDGGKAMQMHQKVMAWVQANLPEKHVFRARVLVRHGNVLEKIGRNQEALISTLQGTQILKDLAKDSRDPETRYYLSLAFYSLGKRYGGLNQSESSILAYGEALQILREQAKARDESRDLLLDALLLQGIQLQESNQLVSAIAAFTEALQILRPLAKNDTGKERLGTILFLLANTYSSLEKLESCIQVRKEAVGVLRSIASTLPNSHTLLTQSLLSLGGEYILNAQPLQAIEPLNEAITLLRSRDRKSNTLKDIAIAFTLLSTANRELGRNDQVLVNWLEVVKAYREMSLANTARREDLAAALNVLAGNYLSLRDYKDALHASTEAASIYRQLAITKPSIKKKLSSTLINLGSALLNLEQTPPALQAIEESVRIYHQLGELDAEDLTSYASSLSSLAGIYGSLDQWEKSLEIQREGVAIRRRVVNTLKIDGTQLTPLMLQKKIELDYLAFLILDLSLLASNYSIMGKKQDALATAQEAAQLSSQLAGIDPNERELLADQLTILSSRFSDVGELQAALDTSIEAVQLSRDLAKTSPKSRELLGDALHELSLRYSSLGRRQDALASSRQAMALRREQRLTDSLKKAQLADSQSVVAYSLTNLGQPREAVSLAQDAVKTFRQLHPRKTRQQSNLAWSLSLLSYHYAQAGEDRDALSAAEESIAIYRILATKRSSYAVELARPLLVLGLAHQNLGNPEQAFSCTIEAIQLLRRSSETDLSKRYVLASALNQLSQLQVKAGSYQSATASATESVAILRELSTLTPEVLDQLSNSSTTLAALSLRQGQSAAAIPLLKEAVNSEVRFLQQQLPLMPEGRRQALVDSLGRRWEIPFTLAQHGEAGGSLALHTRLNRHGTLQDIERRQAIISRSTAASQALVARLLILNGQVSNPTITAQARQNAMGESERLQEELYRQLPALQPRLVEISEVASQLPTDGVLVEFQRFSPYNPAKMEKETWGKPRYLALLLDRRGSTRAMDLGEADALDQAIATALDRTRLQQPGADSAWAIVTEKVFSPLRSAIEGKRHLLVSPDSQLHRVPFSALALLAGSIPSLPTSLSLHTIGSGRDLVTASSKFAPVSTALVLADPTTTGWAPLARAASEGQAVATSLGTRPLFGLAASVAVLEKARAPRVLHVAGHGYFDPQATEDPLLASGLVLAGADKARQPSRTSSPQTSSSSALPSPHMDDGYLTAKEAARLNLDGTQLVVLSACETGLGLQRTGEGLFGLQRALTVAGARGTLLSLWKVPDAATEIFMSRFYALLGQGIPPAEGVHRVQAEFRSQPRINGWSDPFYWAGWQYNGLPDLPR